jgi:flagellar basal-body rod protein FlgG
MDRSLWIAATGMEAQSMLTENIANNLSNVNTTAFKKGQVHFQDLFYQNITQEGAETSDNNLPVGITLGTGVRVSSVSKDFRSGAFTQSSGELDLAIAGDGFFEVDLPGGGKAYSRDGHFHRDASGIMVNESGYALAAGITIDTAAENVTIAADGTVNALVNGSQVNAGTILISRFPNNEGLQPIGDNLFIATNASGDVTNGTPGQDGRGQIRQFYLEASNVEVVKEMVTMIAAQRAYEVISKSIKTSDEMLRSATNLK